MKNAPNKVKIFQNNWDIINDDVMIVLSKKLNIDWPVNCRNIQARVGVMSSCPRYISMRTFDTGITNNIDRMREVTLYEICHF